MNNQKQIDTIKKWLGAGSINIFGRPFSGKDYQGQQLVELFGGNLVGGGKILRSSNLPERAKKCIHNGQLIPSEDYANIVLPFLNQPHLANKSLILSSFGRWHGEEEGVIKAMEVSGHPLKAVIYLALSDQDIYDRWQSAKNPEDRQGRYDDSEEILKTRFKEFQEKTIPVLDYYRDLGLLTEIDGKRTRDEVTQDIFDALNKRAQTNQT